MAISFTYVQKRRNFGKKYQFSNVGPILLVDINPDNDLKSKYIQVPSIEKETQCSSEMSLHEVNIFTLTEKHFSTPQSSISYEYMYTILTIETCMKFVFSNTRSFFLYTCLY